MENKKVITVVTGSKNHYPYIECVLNLFKSDVNDIFLIEWYDEEVVNHKLKEDISNLRISEKDFIRKVRRQFLNSDLIILDEPFRIKIILIYLFLIFKSNSIIVLTIHNVNTWFKPSHKYNIKSILKKTLRRILLSNSNIVSIVASNVFSYVSSTYNKPFVYLPFYSFEKIEKNNEIKRPASGLLRVVVPGTISERRQYDDLIEYVVKDEEYKDKVEFVFLGKPTGPYGKNIIQKCKALQDVGYKIKFFEKFIPRDSFEEYLYESDIILSVFNPVFITDDGEKEIYGKTKETGVSFLALSFSKPIILPEDYIPLNEIYGQVLTYKNYSEIKDIINRILSDDKYLDEYKESSCRNNYEFRLDSIKENIDNFI